MNFLGVVRRVTSKNWLGFGVELAQVTLERPGEGLRSLTAAVNHLLSWNLFFSASSLLAERHEGHPAYVEGR